METSAPGPGRKKCYRRKQWPWSLSDLEVQGRGSESGPRKSLSPNIQASIRRGPRALPGRLGVVSTQIIPNLCTCISKLISSLRVSDWLSTGDHVSRTLNVTVGPEPLATSYSDGHGESDEWVCHKLPGNESQPERRDQSPSLGPSSRTPSGAVVTSNRLEGTRPQALRVML